MKEYLVFIGNCYYPKEGIDDFKKDFDDLDEAKIYAIENIKNYKWYQIVTKEFQKIESKWMDSDGNLNVRHY